jgi:acetyl esterase
MPLQPDVEFMLSQLTAMGAPKFSTQTPAQARTAMEKMSELGNQFAGPPSPEVAAVDRRIPSATGDIPVRVYTPPAGVGTQLPGLVFFHGGGWVIGSVATYERECRDIAVKAGCVVVSVDYRLAPEHKFPAAVDDCVAATRWVAANAAALGIDDKRLAVGGDSAGGNLAAVTALELRGEVPLSCQLLIYPATDSVNEYPSQREPDVGLLSQADASWFMGHYLTRPEDRQNPRMSPLLASSLVGLPPAIVAVCEFDPLRDQGVAYADALTAAGVPTEKLYFAGHVHGFLSLAPVVPSARAAVDELLHAFRRVLHGQ